mmetsp:Transcript_31959/g.56439  ORF Transcript_31959/g.56439 Transcript_31959/m.56439 type:complete len:207 (-) Transcript_31959:474-1094(-)
MPQTRGQRQMKTRSHQGKIPFSRLQHIASLKSHFRPGYPATPVVSNQIQAQVLSQLISELSAVLLRGLTVLGIAGYGTAMKLLSVKQSTWRMSANTNCRGLLLTDSSVARTAGWATTGSSFMLQKRMWLPIGRRFCCGLLILVVAVSLMRYTQTSWHGSPKSRKNWNRSMGLCQELCMPTFPCRSILIQRPLTRRARCALASLTMT